MASWQSPASFAGQKKASVEFVVLDDESDSLSTTSNPIKHQQTLQASSNNSLTSELDDAQFDIDVDISLILDHDDDENSESLSRQHSTDDIAPTQAYPIAQSPPAAVHATKLSSTVEAAQQSQSESGSQADLKVISSSESMMENQFEESFDDRLARLAVMIDDLDTTDPQFLIKFKALRARRIRCRKQREALLARLEQVNLATKDETEIAPSSTAPTELNRKRPASPEPIKSLPAASTLAASEFVSKRKPLADTLPSTTATFAAAAVTSSPMRSLPLPSMAQQQAVAAPAIPKGVPPGASGAVPDWATTAYVFCDGACRNNGKAHARAGFGVSVQAPLGVEIHGWNRALGEDELHTNQRAELRALLSSLQSLQTLRPALVAGGFQAVHIYSDSMYAIKCATVWGRAWQAVNWTRGSRSEEIKHLDIIKPLYAAMLQASRDAAIPCQLAHVKAHQAPGTSLLGAGNSRADELATSSL